MGQDASAELGRSQHRGFQEAERRDILKYEQIIDITVEASTNIRHEVKFQRPNKPLSVSNYV
jgi:hypothetical protein